MKLNAVLLALLPATLVTARSFIHSSDQQILDEVFKVPGDNPLEFCADPKDYLATIEKVDLIPNPPEPGKPLHILANGTFLEEVKEGAKVHLQVKYNKYITLINTVQSLCENLPKIDLKCPVKKGALGVDKSVDIPKVVPPGTYDVQATLIDQDDKEIVCLKASVCFGPRCQNS